jgi:ABC-type multidrug transport system fused ATPase/permease subunit
MIHLSKLRFVGNLAKVRRDSLSFHTGTIKDNIEWGNEDASMEETIEAVKIAQAHDFIMSFEKGYDMEVSKRGRRGIVNSSVPLTSEELSTAPSP